MSEREVMDIGDAAEFLGIQRDSLYKGTYVFYSLRESRTCQTQYGTPTSRES